MLKYFISDALSVALSSDFLQVSSLPDGSLRWLVHVRKYSLLEEIMTFYFNSRWVNDVHLIPSMKKKAVRQWEGC